MRHRLLWLAVLASAVLLGAIAATASPAAADSGQLTIIGPWQGKDAASFQAVLSAFTQQNPEVTVTYKPVTGDVAAALPASAADLAVLSLPADQAAMAAMERSGALKSLDFAGPAITANYAYSWKLLGSVDNKLTGLFFKATNRSAFWYDTAAFKNLGLTPPKTWHEFRQVVDKIEASGLSPFALSGASNVALPNVFQNIYLTFQGNRAYDNLAAGALSWHNSTVYGALNVLKNVFRKGIAGGTGSLSQSYPQAVKQVFGSPMKAYMVPGGSAVLPVVASSNAMRPLSRFSVFAFPQLGKKSAPRVIGDADAVVMAKDSPAARSLINYLATPAAAAIWAKRGGDFLSPNNHVLASAYAVPQMATLAHALAGAGAFRFAIADMKPATFARTMTLQLERYLRKPTTAGDVVAHIAIAAGEKK
jgi:alpha-glucoside transport system substrate-binding protein